MGRRVNRIRMHLVLALVSAVAGCLATCFVVVLLVQLVGYHRMPIIQRNPAGHGTDPVLVFSGFGSEYVQWFDEESEGRYIGDGSATAVRFDAHDDWAMRWSWSRLLRREPGLYSYEEGRGWPFKAFRTYMLFDSSATPPHLVRHGAFATLKDGEARWMSTSRQLRVFSPIYVTIPSEMVPLGFLADSVFYGSIVYAILSLIRWWARRGA